MVAHGYAGEYTLGMTATTVKVPTEVRDRLAALAAVDFAGAPLGQVIEVLITEHEDRRLHRDILDAYQRLRADADAWSGYTSELEEWDTTAGDGTADR